MKRWTAAALLAVFLGSQGCAALFAGKQTAVPVQSQPAGAEVWVDGVKMGETPMTVNLSHNKDHVVVFKKDGYDDATVPVSKSLGAGWVVLDVLGGLIPVIIDAATGSWYTIPSTPLSPTLAAKSAH